MSIGLLNGFGNSRRVSERSKGLSSTLRSECFGRKLPSLLPVSVRALLQGVIACLGQLMSKYELIYQTVTK